MVQFHIYDKAAAIKRTDTGEQALCQEAKGNIENMNKILIVDDEPNNRLLLQEILEDAEEDGARLLYAVDGVQALDRILSEKPALVFLDIMLPEMDGFDVCSTIKSKPGFENIFIAVITARGQEADRKKAMEAKADMYIAKPFKKRAILDIVNKVFHAGADR